MEDRESRIKDIEHRESRIGDRASNNEDRESRARTENPESRIENQESRIEHRELRIENRDRINLESRIDNPNRESKVEDREALRIEVQKSRSRIENRGPQFFCGPTQGARKRARERERERSALYRQQLNSRVCLRVCWLCFLASNSCTRFDKRLLSSTVPGQLHGPRWQPLLSVIFFCCLRVHVVLALSR